jgi:hypothetical protein
MPTEPTQDADYAACQTCGLPVAGGKGDWWHVAPGGGYGEMRGPDGHLASPGHTERFSEGTRHGAAVLLAALETIPFADRPNAIALFAKAAMETGWWVR